MTTPSASREVLTRPERFVVPYDARRRPVRRSRQVGGAGSADTVPLPPTAVATGRSVFVAELDPVLPDDLSEAVGVDTLELLRTPVGRSTTSAVLTGLDQRTRDRVAELTVQWVDTLAPVITAGRTPRSWSPSVRAERRAWRALLAAVTASGQEDPAARATSLAAGVQVPIAAGAWCLTLLADEPALQVALRADPTLVPGFVWEVLRLYPPTWLIGRVSTGEEVLDGTTLPAYTPVVVSPVVLGRLPALVPGPESGHRALDRVDPTRWTAGVVRPGAWLPFGAGPHACPGRNLGLAQLQELVTWAAGLDLFPTGPLHAVTAPGLSPRPSRILVRRHRADA